MQLAMFGDVGVAWDKNDELKKENAIGGYGVGLRLLVPFVNQFRFDLAKGEAGKSFTVNIGAAVKPVAQRFRVR